MHHTTGMSMSKCIGDQGRDAKGIVHPQRQELRERNSIDELHRDEDVVAFFSCIKDSYDIWVAKAR